MSVMLLRGLGRSVFVCVAIASLTAAPAHAEGPAFLLAATITVNSTADNTTGSDGKCTLREAVANVNAAADTTGGDCAAGTGAGDTIVFDLTLPATITLTASTELAISREVTISGPTTGALAVDGNQATRVFEIMARTAHIANLAIQNGEDNDGGGMYVAAGGTATLTNCMLNRNWANRGGSLYVGGGGAATLTDCTLSGNQDGVFGEGVYVAAGGTATLTNCTLSGNQAYEGGGGEGGGIYVAGGGTAMLTNCTLSDNYDVGGGGLANYGTATLTNCTLSGNIAGDGGGLANHGTATLTNTIVANSRGGGNCSGKITSRSHNLDSDGTCKLSSPGDLSDTDPEIGPLQGNGGPTFTLALLPDSPAVDAGGPNCPPTDQRGVSRPQGAACDIGAYEFAAVTCAGDCNQNSAVTVDEIISMVTIALGDAEPSACPGDGGAQVGHVTVARIIQATHNALNGCER
jgi:CSLREA domain-containing protein